MIAGHVYTPPHGTRGFDCNVALTPQLAAAFAGHGYRFAGRYIPRMAGSSNDLTAREVQEIFNAGMGVTVFQHVESETAWIPTHEKGAAYGHGATEYMRALGLPSGVLCWLDLEGVAAGTSPEVVVDYCKAWFTMLAFSGYVPGVYVGWRCGLDADRLYHDLPFVHYAGAYNLNADQAPAVRGVQLRQHAATEADRPDGVDIPFDVQIAQSDALGGAMTVLGPDGWPC